MSTNEELAQAIQDGHSEAVGVLWEQVEKFTRQQARRYWNGLTAATIEIDDLVQVGFFALMDAVAGFDPDKGGFLTYYGHQLHHHFSECAGLHSQRQRREAATVPVLSLDRPLDQGDPDSGTLGDLVPDPESTMGFANAEQAVYQRQLHEALESHLRQLPERQAEVVRRRFYGNETRREVAEAMGTNQGNIEPWEKKALYTLRRKSADLREFLYYDHYHGVGYGSFAATGSSAQERFVMWQEERQERRKHTT